MRRKVGKEMGAPRLEYALSLYSVLSGNQKLCKNLQRKSYREEKNTRPICIVTIWAAADPSGASAGISNS